MSDELNFVQRARREKLDALVAAGVAPFAYGFDRTHESAAAVAALPEGRETGDTVRVAGRLVAWRGMVATGNEAGVAPEELYALADAIFAYIDRLCAATVEGYGELPIMRVEDAGYGAGTARLDFPNVTRVLIGTEESAASLPSVPGTPELRLVPEPREPNDPGDAG